MIPHVEQRYLNTCIAAVFVQEVCVLIPEEAARRELAIRVFGQLESAFEQYPRKKEGAFQGGPSAQDHVNGRLIQARRALEKGDILGALEEALSLSFLVEPGAPITLNTPRRFKQLGFGISAACAAAELLRGRLLQKIKRAPRLREAYHLGYVCYSGCEKLLAGIVPPSRITQRIAPYGLDKRAAKTLLERLSSIHGVKLERPGHAYFMHARCEEVIWHDPMKPRAENLDLKGLQGLMAPASWEIFWPN